MKYFGVPIVGRDMRLSNCGDLLGQLKCYLDKWKNRALSYGGQVQLVTWTLMGKLIFSFNALIVITIGKGN